MLPAALVIGPMKAGTTWIHDYLTWRGDVALPRGVKETFFFDRYHDRGLGWYSGHFDDSGRGPHLTSIEVAPSLFHCPQAPRRVAEALGPVPLVVTTRDPVGRAWSHYLHLRRKGYTRAPLAEALAAFPEIVAASRYAEQIARWNKALPTSPVTVLSLERLRHDPAGYAADLCAALGLPEREPPPDLGESNAGGTPPSFMIARLGRKIASGLRSMGGYGAVNLAKQLGLKRVFFGADGGTRQAPTEEERDLLLRAISAGREGEPLP